MTYKVITILFIVLATLLLIVACAKKVEQKPKIEVKETATEKGVSSIGSSISEIDKLNEEIDISELDDIEEGLAEIEELDLE